MGKTRTRSFLSFGFTQCLLGFPTWRFPFTEITYMGMLNSLTLNSLLNAVGESSTKNQSIILKKKATRFIVEEGSMFLHYYPWLQQIEEFWLWQKDRKHYQNISFVFTGRCICLARDVTVNWEIVQGIFKFGKISLKSETASPVNPFKTGANSQKFAVVTEQNCLLFITVSPPPITAPRTHACKFMVGI